MLQNTLRLLKKSEVFNDKSGLFSQVQTTGKYLSIFTVKFLIKSVIFFSLDQNWWKISKVVKKLLESKKKNKKNSLNQNA